MRKHIFITLLAAAFLMPSESFGQRWKLKRYEATIGLGTTHAFMDIGIPNESIRSFQLLKTRTNASVGASFYLEETVELNLDLSYLMFSGEDKEDHLEVNSFTTHAFEPALTVRYSFLKGGKAFGTTAVFNRRGMVNSYGTADIYVFAGVGGLLSKAKVIDDSGEIFAPGSRGLNNNLRFDAVFPLGAGFKYDIDAWWSLGIEVNGRLSLSDYIDGFATENSEYNDTYITTNIKAIYKIRSDRRGRPILNRYGYTRRR